MSKYEDRTDPYAVKARRHRRERHDHRNGVCELQADPNNIDPGRPWGSKCFLDVNWFDPEMRCSCKMCSAGLKEINRKKRYAGRREARDWKE